MSHRRSQSTKNTFKKYDSSLNNSEVHSNDKINQDDNQRKNQASVITLSSLAQKILNYSNQNKQKEQYQNDNRDKKIYNINNLDYDSTLQILDLALRLVNIVQNETEADIQQFVTINNLAVLCNKLGKLSLSKKYLKQVLNKIQINYPENKSDLIEIIEALTINNICSVYLEQQNYEKVYKYSEQALILIENKIFKRIKEEGESSLKKDTQFISDLHILLQGYIYRGWSQDEIKNLTYLEYIQKNDEVDESFSDKQKIYNNGYRLSSIILGKESKMAKMFQQLAKQAKQDQHSIQEKLFKDKETEFNEQGRVGLFKYYKNRIDKTLDILSDEYLQSNIEDKLYILKYSIQKQINSSFSEQNNIIIIDSQEDQADELDTHTITIQKEDYKVNPIQNQPSSPMSIKAQRNDSKNTINKKIIFRNQSPNLKLNQNIKQKQSMHYVPNGSHHYNSGIKERAQSHHTGANSYYLNHTAGNRGYNENVGNESNYINMNNQNGSQFPQQYFNNSQQGYMAEGGMDIGQIQGQELQGLNRHQQLQQQLLLAGNGMVFNKRFNSHHNLQNPNYINNTINTIESQNPLQQQHDYLQQTNHMYPYQQMPQLAHQASLGTPLQNNNQFGQQNRFSQFINGISPVTNTNQPQLPQIQTALSPNQILYAQIQSLAGLKYPIIPNNGGLNQQLSLPQTLNQTNAQKNMVQQLAQGNIMSGNEVNQIQQNMQKEFIDINKNQIQLNNVEKQILQQQIGQQNTNQQNIVNQNINQNQQMKVQNNLISNYGQTDKNLIHIDLQNERINDPFKQINTQQQQQQQQSQLNKQYTNDSDHNYFALNKDYNAPESAAFPNVVSPEKPKDSMRKLSIIRNIEKNGMYKPAVVQNDNISEQKDDIKIQNPTVQINNINDKNKQNDLIQIKNEQGEDKGDLGQINIPLFLIEKKSEQSQNGDGSNNTPQNKIVKTNNQSQQPQIAQIKNFQSNEKNINNIDNKIKKEDDQKQETDQKRYKYQEQVTKEIVSLKNIPAGYIGSSQAESHVSSNIATPLPMVNQNMNNFLKQNDNKIINQILLQQKEEDEFKDEILQNKQKNTKNIENVKIGENMKLSESQAYPLAYSPQVSNQNKTNIGNNNVQNTNNTLNSPQVTPTNRGINPQIMNSPTSFINNAIMMQTQQFQNSQILKQPPNLKKLTKEEDSYQKLAQSPQSQSSQNYSNLYKHPINTNMNGIQGGGGQQFFTYPQNNNQNNQINPKGVFYQGMNQQRSSSKQRIPSINAILLNQNSQNMITQNLMVQSDMSIHRHIKQSEVDLLGSGSSKQNQWAVFSDNDTEYLRHITLEYLSTVNCTVSKILQFNSIQYVVEIGINKNSLELSFELSGYQLLNKMPLQTEFLPLNIVKGILGILDLSEGTPFNKPFKTIQGFRDLCQYLIFPFIKINESQRKIEINYTLHSLIQYSQWQIEFMKQTCNATLNHLNNNEFKLTLKSNEKDSIRIDICFDEATMKQQFQKMECPSDEKIENYEREEIKQIVDILDQFDEEEVNVNKKEKIQELNEKLLEIKKFQKICLLNYHIPNSLIFLQKLTDLLSLIQSFLLKTHNYSTFQQYIDDQSFKVLRVHVNDDFKKGQIYFIKENPPQQSKTVCVSIQNIHETHVMKLNYQILNYLAPHGKFVQCIGKKDIDIQDFWKLFGIEYEKYDKDEKYLFFTLLGFKYNLYTHTKPLEEDDYGRYQENPIIINNTCIGGYSRIFKNDQYSYPLTCQLIGFEDIAYGVKVTLHDQEQNSEQGIFLATDPLNWIKFKKQEDPNAKKKRTKKYKDEFDIIKNYELANVLASIGYKLIENQIGFRKTQNQPIIVGRNLNSGFISNIDRLENVVCIDEVVKNLIQLFQQ